MNLVCDDDKPLLKDGVYEAQCLGYDDKFILGKTKKLFLNFKILTGEYTDKKIFQAFNIPYNEKPRTGHKYYKVWVMVNGWKKPSRNTEMSPKLFLNRIYKIRTRTVKPKYYDKEMPKDFWYSVVDEICEVLA